MKFDFNKLKELSPDLQYSQQLERIATKNKLPTTNIEKTVEESLLNINEGCNSFVIYGEPQSGKTEMMIALTARLLDENFKIIIIWTFDKKPIQRYLTNVKSLF